MTDVSGLDITRSSELNPNAKHLLQEADTQGICANVIQTAKVPWWTSCRLAFAALCFLGLVNWGIMRGNMSVAIICMVNQTALSAEHVATSANGSVGNDTCVSRDTLIDYKEGVFSWNKETQGIILGSFFWGYIITQIPGGWIAKRTGGKRIYGYSMFVAAIATLLTPIGASGGPYVLMVLNFIRGLGQGVVYPAMYELWAHWAPPKERSILLGFSCSGDVAGNIITFPFAGILCQHGFAGGWPSIFYASGIFGVIWFILWMTLVSDSPARHPRITSAERNYILREIGTRETTYVKTPPWMSIAQSKPFWSIVVAHSCFNWTFFSLMTNIPSYMREVLAFNVSTLYSSLPYIVMSIAIVVSGIVADKMISKFISTVVARKIMTSVGMLVPAAFLAGIGHVTCENPHVGVAILTIGAGCLGVGYSGFLINHLDIAPPFAGVLMAITNTIAAVPGVLAPYAIGRITSNQTQQQWQVVFYLTAAINTIGAIFYDVFADGEVQYWVYPRTVDAKPEVHEVDVQHMDVLLTPRKDTEIIDTVAHTSSSINCV